MQGLLLLLELRAWLGIVVVFGGMGLLRGCIQIHFLNIITNLVHLSGRLMPLKDHPVPEESPRLIKPEKVKLRRSKRIAAQQKNEAKEVQPTRRSARIAAKKKRKACH